MAECSISVSSWHMSEIVIDVTCGSNDPSVVGSNAVTGGLLGRAGFLWQRSDGRHSTCVLTQASAVEVFVASTSIDWRYSIKECGTRVSQPQKMHRQVSSVSFFIRTEAFRLNGFWGVEPQSTSHSLFVLPTQFLF